MIDNERAVEILRWRLVRAMSLRSGFSMAGGWCLAWGMVVLIARYVWLTPSSSLAWGFAGIAVVMIASGYWAWIRIPVRQSLTAILDRHNNLGGLLMASESAELGPWAGTMPSLDVPEVNVKLRSAGMLLSAGIVFLAIGLALPNRIIRFDLARPMDVSQPAAQLNHQIETLEEHKIIEPRIAQSYKQQLDEIKQQSDGADPARTWEALDHLQSQVERQTTDLLDKATRQNAALQQARALNEAMMNADPSVDAKTLSEAASELNQLVQQATNENAVTMDIPEELQKALQGATLTPEEMKKLGELLKNSNGDLKKMMADLKNARMIDAAALRKLSAYSGSYPGDDDEDENIFGEARSGISGKSRNKHLYSLADFDQLIAQCRTPGNGGPGGGGPPADLTWKSMSEEEGAKFKEIALPPDDAKSLKDSRLTGLSSTAPKLDTKSTGSTHDALANANASGGEAHANTVLPRHQGPVERFFERSREHSPEPGAKAP